MGSLELRDIPQEEIPKLAALLERFFRVRAEYIPRGAHYSVTTVTMLSTQYFGDMVETRVAARPLYRVELYDAGRTIHGVGARFIPYEGIDETLDGALEQAMDRAGRG